MVRAAFSRALCLWRRRSTTGRGRTCWTRRTCGRGGAAAAPVKVETVQRGIFLHIFSKTRHSKPKDGLTSSAQSRAGHRITKRRRRPVRAGTIMARLDADAAQISVAQREVAHLEANSRYEREDALFQRNLGSSSLMKMPRPNSNRPKRNSNRPNRFELHGD